jgi:hypothetical protein
MVVYQPRVYHLFLPTLWKLVLLLWAFPSRLCLALSWADEFRACVQECYIKRLQNV